MDKSINTFCDLNELAGLYEKADGLNDFLQTVVSTIAYHMEAAVCSIYLHDAASGELLLAANQGLNRSVVGQLRLKMGEGLTGKALVTKSSVCEGLGSNHPDFKHFPGIDEEQYQAFLAVPVLRAERKIGVIVVQDPEPDYFDSKSIDILENISHQLAGPIEDAMLFISIHEVVEHRQRQLELDYNEPIFVKGISGTDGIAKGKTVRLDQNSYDVLTAIDDDEDCTIETFETAIKKTEAQKDRFSGICVLLFFSCPSDIR
jgi:phosphotransferase system enzyme I (PtsP)